MSIYSSIAIDDLISGIHVNKHSSEFISQGMWIVTYKVDSLIGSIIIECQSRHIMSDGEVVEWLMALVLKTSMSARASWVRIPPSPFYPQHEGPLTTI